MTLRKRYVASLLGVAFLLSLGIKFSLDWRQEFVSAAESVGYARLALQQRDTDRAIHFLDEGLERSSQDLEEQSTIIFQELDLLDSAPPLPLADAARLYRYRLKLQLANCHTQSWQKMLLKRIKGLGLSREESALRFNMLHPGRELLEASVAEGDTIGTFAAWRRGRMLGQELKDTGGVPDSGHVLRALDNLKTRELDVLNLTHIPASPILGWLRSAWRLHPDDPMILRGLTVGLAIAKEDDLLADRPLPRQDTLIQAIDLADQFVAANPANVSAQVTRIAARVRAAELAALPADPSAQQLLDDFARHCPVEANWRDILRATDCQIRNIRFLDPGSPEGGQAIANVRRLTGVLLERRPGTPDALLALGRLYRQLGEYQTARNYYQQAANTRIEMSPTLIALTCDLASGLASLEIMDMDLAAAEAADTVDTSELDRLEQALDRVADRLGNQSGDVLLARGRIKLLRGQQREAIRDLEEACKQAGGARPEAFYYVGVALAAVGETGASTHRLDLYLHLAGTTPEHRLVAARTLAAVALSVRPPDEAMKQISELSADHPDDGPMALARAEAALHATLQMNADQASRTAGLTTVNAILLRLTTAGDEQALLLAAQAEALLGEGDESLARLESFCHGHPRNVPGILAWCQVLQLRGDVAREEQEVRSLVLPHASPLVAAMLERALARESGPRNQLYPLIRLAFEADPAEQQLGLFWVNWGLDDSTACEQALAAGLALRPDHPGLLAARLALLLDVGQTGRARQFLSSLPATIPEWQRQLWEAKLCLVVRDFAGAARTLGTLLSRNPHLSEANALQGDLALARGKTAEATLRYQDSLADNPSQPIALEGIVGICFEGHKPVEAFTYLRRLVRLNSPSQPRLESLLLSQLAESGTNLTATRLRSNRQQQAPWDRENRLQLALLQLRSRQANQAMQTLQRLLKENPGDLEILAQLARTLAEHGQQREARKVLVEVSAQATAVGNDPACLEVTRLLIDMGATDEARSLLERAVASGGSTADSARFQLANLLYDADQWAAAGALYAACSGAKTQADLLRRRVECAIWSGDLPAARSLLDTLERRAPDDPLVQVLTAEFALRSGDEKWADAACARALTLDPGCATAFLVRARLRLHSGSDEATLATAVDDLEKACIRDPKLLVARELLVRLQLERGKTAEAEASLRLLLGACPNDHRLKVALARLLLEVGRNASLASLVKIWKADWPEATFWMEIEGMLAQAQGHTSEAARAFARHAAATGDPESLLAAVDGFLAAGMPDEARRLCADLTPTASTPIPVLVALARLRPETARDLLAQALARTRDSDQAGTLLAQARKILPAAELVAWLQGVQAKSPSQATSLALAQLWQDTGQAAQAVDLLQTLAAQAQGSDRAELLSRLAAAELVAGHRDRAEEALRAALAITPNQPALLNNAAHLALLAGGREAEAVRLARQAVAACVDDRDLQACALSTMAEALFALRLYDQVREALLKALAIHDTPEDRLLLGRALLASGRGEQGLIQLRRARELAEREGKSDLVRQITALL